MVVAILLPWAAAFGADKLTLDDCIELALRHRSSIISARGSEDLAKANRLAALGSFLPNVSASYSYSKGETRDQEVRVPYNAYEYTDYEYFVDTIEVDGTQFPVLAQRATDSLYLVDMVSEQPDQSRTSKGYGLSANLSLSGATFFDYFSARTAAQRASLNVIASEQDLIYEVKGAFYAYLAAVENVSVQEDAVERSKEQLKLIESRFELGSAAKSDVLKQKVQYGNDRLSLLEAKNSVTSSKADLAYTVGLDPHSDVEFSTDYMQRSYDGTMDEAIQYGLDNQPTLLSAKKYEVETGHDLRAAHMSYLPSFSAYGNLNWSDGSSGDTVLYNSKSNSWTLGFGLSMNIFDGFSRERNVASAKIARNNARAALTEEKHLVSLQIKQAYLEIEKTSEQVKVNEENVAAAEEDLKITQEKYNLGAATILDLLDAQVSLKEAQMSKISSEFDYNLAVAALEHATGKM